MDENKVHVCKYFISSFIFMFSPLGIFIDIIKQRLILATKMANIASFHRAKPLETF